MATERKEFIKAGAQAHVLGQQHLVRDENLHVPYLDAPFVIAKISFLFLFACMI